MNPPPHNDRAERIVLAALMREPQLATEACIHYGVTGDDLYQHNHRLVWDAAWSLVDSGGVPDLVGVWQVLVCRRQTRELAPTAPALWLAEVWETDPTGAWCDWACGVVRWNADRRAVIHRAREVMRRAMEGAHVPDLYEMAR